MCKTTQNCTGKITRRCSACKLRKWRGDYALTICVLSGKVIEPYYYCDIPNEIYEKYKEYKNEGNYNIKL